MKTLSVLFILLVVSCAQKTQENKPPITPTTTATPPSTEEKNVSLLLFSTGWCVSCKEHLPEVNTLIQQKMTAEQKKSISLQIYLVEGYEEFEDATETDLMLYKKELGIEAQYISDPNWKTYESYFGKKGKIPTAAIVGPKDEKTIFNANQKFDPEKIVETLKNKLN